MKATVNNSFIFLAIFAMTLSVPSMAIKRYVTPTGAGTFSGLSWANASGNLQVMIDASVSGDQIRMKAGTYYPIFFPAGCTGCGTPSVSNRNNTFSMKNGVRITGGFAGWESEEWQRNKIVNKTILSGNLGVPAVFTDNAYHVIMSINNPAVTLVDVTIEGGNANGTSSIVVGGRTAYQAWGGGSLNINANTTFGNCVLQFNRAESGGAILNSNYASSSLSSTVVLDNTALNGGAIYCHDHGFAYIDQSTLVNNSATAAGGALYVFNASIVNIYNSIIWGNTAPLLPAIALNSGTASGFSSIIQGGITPCTGCPNTNGNSNPLFFNITKPRGNDNVIGTYDDGLNLRRASPAIDTGDFLSTAEDILGRRTDGAMDIGAYYFMDPQHCFSAFGAIPGRYVGESPIATDLYLSKNLIISDAQTANSGSITFWAENAIELKPGFSTVGTVTFKAEIIPTCDAIITRIKDDGIH